MKRLLQRLYVLIYSVYLNKILNVDIKYDVDINRKTCFEGYNKIGRCSKINSSYIGQGTYMGINNNFVRCKIGRFCSIANNVKVASGTHPTQTFVSYHPSFFSISKQAGFCFVSENKFQENKMTRDNWCVEIGNDVWIGEGVIILGGVKIGDGACIAAGAVVTKDIEPYSIVGGIPAKHIRYRFSEEQRIFLQKYKWWNKDFKWLRENVNLFEDINRLINYEQNK